MSSPAAGKLGAVEIREDRGTLPDLQPWRQVGWIFHDGEVTAIERCDKRTGDSAVSEDEEPQSS
ncbi:MAG TPA: hypothetical protein VGG38_09630 [Acidimicrobiales bacterium]